LVEPPESAALPASVPGTEESVPIVTLPSAAVPPSLFAVPFVLASPTHAATAAANAVLAIKMRLDRR
jgi:hypothetical protein